MVLYGLLWWCYAVSTVWCCMGYSGVAMQLVLYVLYGLLWCCYAVSTVWCCMGYSGVAMQLVLYGVVSVTLVLLCS